MRTRSLLLVLGAAATLSACGGTRPPTTPDPLADTFAVSVIVFYDENGNGQQDVGEAGRIPGVVIQVGNATATTSPATGQALVAGVARGLHSVSAHVETLPTFYQAEAMLEISVPETTEVKLPATLPIQGNRPGTHLAFGNSITEGEGSTDDEGYTFMLEDRLRMAFGIGEIIKDGLSGTTSEMGAARLGTSLRRERPAFVLIHYGTNDWNDCEDVVSCPTLASLESMVVQAKGFGSLPVLATILPSNTGFDARSPPRRNDWVAEANEFIRPLAAREGALLVDLNAAFFAEGVPLAALFTDHVHPNDRGYEIMAREFFETLSQPATELATTSLFARVAFGPHPTVAHAGTRPGFHGFTPPLLSSE